MGEGMEEFQWDRERKDVAFGAEEAAREGRTGLVSHKKTRPAYHPHEQGQIVRWHPWPAAWLVKLDTGAVVVYFPDLKMLWGELVIMCSRLEGFSETFSEAGRKVTHTYIDPVVTMLPVADPDENIRLRATSSRPPIGAQYSDPTGTNPNMRAGPPEYLPRRAFLVGRVVAAVDFEGVPIHVDTLAARVVLRTTYASGRSTGFSMQSADTCPALMAARARRVEREAVTAEALKAPERDGAPFWRAWEAVDAAKRAVDVLNYMVYNSSLVKPPPVASDEVVPPTLLAAMTGHKDSTPAGPPPPPPTRVVYGMPADVLNMATAAELKATQPRPGDPILRVCFLDADHHPMPEKWKDRLCWTDVDVVFACWGQQYERRPRSLDYWVSLPGWPQRRDAVKDGGLARPPDPFGSIALAIGLVHVGFGVARRAHPLPGGAAPSWMPPAPDLGEPLDPSEVGMDASDMGPDPFDAMSDAERQAYFNLSSRARNVGWVPTRTTGLRVAAREAVRDPRRL